MRYRFIKDYQGKFSIAAMCRVLTVSASGYYAWCGRSKSARIHANEALLEQKKTVYKESRATYGSPRMHRELKDRGAMCGRHRVARLMRKHGIYPKRKRRFKVTTDSKHALPVAANVLDRKFDVCEADKVWASDITYIPTQSGWLYLAVVLDLCSRRVIGWSMQSRMDENLVKDALKMALDNRRPAAIHHSDRGCQLRFNRSSQHLIQRLLLWANLSVVQTKLVGVH